MRDGGGEGQSFTDQNLFVLHHVQVRNEPSNKMVVRYNVDRQNVDGQNADQTVCQETKCRISLL